MKVFDFTNGTKGDLLGHIKITDYAGGCFVEKDGSTFKVQIRQRGRKNERWSWHSNSGHTVKGKDIDLDPKDFGVEAICFCTGEFFHQWKDHANHPDSESHWQWDVIGTADWNREACKSGILKATKQA